MKHVKPFALFESEKSLTPRQIKFLDEYTKGSWRINPATGLVDVDGDFNCSAQELSDFKGVRFGKVGGGFHCGSNQLSSLEGAPREVRWDFNCNNNQLTSLKGAPQKVGEDLYCRNNPVSEKTLGSILVLMMKNGESYLESVEYLWTEIPVEDQALLYRPEFEWVGADERRKLDALRAYQGFKSMI